MSSSVVRELVWGRRGLSRGGVVLALLGVLLAAAALASPVAYVYAPDGRIGVRLAEYNAAGLMVLLVLLALGFAFSLARRAGLSVVFFGLYFFVSLSTAVKPLDPQLRSARLDLGPGFPALVCSGLVFGLLAVHEHYRVVKGYTLKQTLCEVAVIVANALVPPRITRCRAALIALAAILFLVLGLLLAARLAAGLL